MRSEFVNGVEGAWASQMRLNLEKFSPVTPPFIISTLRPVTRDDSQNLGELLHKAYEGTVDLPFRTLVDRYLTNYEDADFVAA